MQWIILYISFPVHCYFLIIRGKILTKGFPSGSVVKNLPANAGDVGSIPGLERSPGEGNGKPLQYSCLGNPMDRGDWQAKSIGLQRPGHDLVTEQQKY